MALTPGTRLGPYEILGPLGAGGMGEVYRARDARLQRDVAVKVLPAASVADPDRLRRFEQEVRATGQINHPNILAVYDTGTHDGAPYIVEELLEGETLRARLAGSPLPVRKVLDYARQIAAGLAAAHQKGIVHRDLKPENLFVTNDGRLKILDFGLARWTRSDAGDGPAGPAAGDALTGLPTETGTAAGVILGTVGYMSPEQVRGQPADQRSDIFTFGSILYEMLTGRRAFSGPSSVETMSAILKEEPPEISRSQQDLPSGLERIVQHCLEKSPDERFQSARDLGFQLEALSTISAGGAAGAAMAAAAGAAARSGPSGRRASIALPPAVLAAIVVAVCGAVAAAYYAGLRSRAPDVPVTYSQLSFRQGSIFSARFTPDGQSVVYAASWDGHPTGLFTARPGSPESRPLDLPPAEVLAVSASGELALLLDMHFTIGWMRSGTLARAPLSGGVPREVARDVEDADWSPDGQGLVVVRTVAGRYRLEYPTGTVLYETDQWISSPRFSRDGRRIAFIDHPAQGDNRGRIGVVDLDRHVSFLTEQFASTAGVAWSAAGDEIWFTAGRVGLVRAVYAVDLTGRQRTVDGAPADMVIADVSPAGKVLVMRNEARRGLIGTRPGDPTERDLGWFDWAWPGALSADGEWILFSEQGQGGGPDYSVYLRKTDGSPAVRLGQGAGSGLSWDGQWAIATLTSQVDRIDILPRGAGESRTLHLPGFTLGLAGFLPGDTRLLFSANEAGHRVRFYVMDAAGGKPVPITPEGVGFLGALSPDGKLLAVSAPDHRVGLFPIDGGEARAVPGSTADDTPAAWSQDGREIYTYDRAGLGVRVDRIDLGTGRRAPWKTLLPADASGLIDVSFLLMTTDARSYVYSYRRVLSTLYYVDGLR
jgi:Tol biopolymer transport system component